MKPTMLSDRVLRRIDPADRPPGPAGWTAAESGARFVRRTERQEQALFAQWLSLHQSMGELVCFWQRTDKRATGTKGWPDFTVLRSGQTLCLEFKVAGGLFSDAQKEVIERLSAQGIQVAIPATAEEAIRITAQWMATLPALK